MAKIVIVKYIVIFFKYEIMQIRWIRAYNTNIFDVFNKKYIFSPNGEKSMSSAVALFS